MVERRGQGQSLENEVLKRIDLLILELPSKGVRVTKDTFFALLRSFFKEFFHIDFEFTTDELAAQIRKSGALTSEQKEDLTKLSAKLDEDAYSPVEMTEDELKEVIKGFRQIIVGLIELETKSYEKNKAGLDKFMLLGLKKMNELRLKTKESSVQSIYAMIYKAEEEVLAGETGLAHETVRKILSEYAKLKGPGSKEIYPHIMQLNRMIADAEKNEKLKEIEKSLDKVHALMERDKLEEAKEQYSKALKQYKALSDTDKKLVYRNLDDVYDSLLEIEEEKRVERLKGLIGKAQGYIADNQQPLAEEVYAEVEELFHELTKHDQKKVKKDIDSLYFDIFAEARE